MIAPSLPLTASRLHLLRQVRDGWVSVAPGAEPDTELVELVGAGMVALRTNVSGWRNAVLTGAGAVVLAEMERPGL